MSTVKLTAGHQIITFFMFSVFVVGFLMLSQVELEQEFRGTLIFFILLIGSFTGIYIISFTSVFERKLGGEKEARLFFVQDISMLKFAIYVPIGLMGSLGIALLSQNLGLDQQSASLVSIAGSGAVMMVIFFLSKTIMTAIIIHGSFNTLVLALRDGIIGNFTGNELFPVPELGLSTQQFNNFGIVILEQFTMVAFGEEMMKILVIAFVVLSIPNARFKSGITKYLGAILALIIWTAYHTIQAI